MTVASDPGVDGGKSLLSPRQLASVIGVSESSLKRWIDNGDIQAVRTRGGHRRILRAEAMRFIRERGYPIHEPGGLDLVPVETELPLVEQFHDALVIGDAQVARSLLAAAFAAGTSMTALCDGPVREAMARIGTRWHLVDGSVDPAGIATEHLATDTCIQVINALRAYLPEVRDTAPVAVGCAPANDPYLLPSLCAALSLAETGFRTINLGPQTPTESLLHAVALHRPRMVWLSCSTADPARGLDAPLGRLATDLGSRGGALVVGGRCASSLGLTYDAHLRRAASLADLAAVGRSLL